jgi:small subunit ribosomal protein S13
MADNKRDAKEFEKADPKNKSEKKDGGQKDGGQHKDNKDKSAPKAPQKPAAPVEKMEPGLKYFIRILNTDLDGKKQIKIGLTKIKGVGFAFSNAVCIKAKMNPAKKAGSLTPEEIKNLEEVLKNPTHYNIPVWMLNRRKDYETGEDDHLFTSDLDFTRSNDIRRLQRVKAVKGMRHAWGLPVRGQRTKSNFRKNKGKALGVQRAKTAPAKAEK